MKKLFAEMVGTATLVLFGCGAAVMAGNEVGQLGIAFAFGLVIVGLAYGIGAVSGCHVNPAVTLGALIAKRMKAKEAGLYMVAQFIGAALGAAVLFAIASGTSAFNVSEGFGTNGFGAGYLGEYSIMSAIIFEVVATFIFVYIILGATAEHANNKFAGLAIGLTLVFIHIVGIQITGVSVNPARSLGPALFHTPALAQLPIFILAPLTGGALAGVVAKWQNS